MTSYVSRGTVNALWCQHSDKLNWMTLICMFLAEDFLMSYIILCFIHYTDLRIYRVAPNTLNTAHYA